MNIDMFIFSKGKKYPVTNILEKTKWSGDYKSGSRKLEFSLISRLCPVKFECGDLVAYYVDGKKIFDGYIWDDELDSSEDTLFLLAYDKGIYLLRNSLAYNFKNVKAESIAHKVANDLGIAVGNIIATNVNITKVFLGVSAYEIIMSAYTEASKKTGKKYMCYIKNDKLYVEEKGNIKLNISFEEGKNLINTKIKNSLENMVNKVVIVDNNGNKQEEVKNDEWIKLYGTLQDVVQIQENKNNKEEAKIKLKGKETTCSLSGYGDTSCITGYGVQVKDNTTKMLGIFYINTDNHSWENGEYKIDLEISLENIMNEVNAGQDEQKEDSDSTPSDGTTVTGGKEVDCEFTAYYPANNSMEGGFMDAMGNRLDPSKLTCAAPKNIAFGTKIQVKCTNTSKDNLVYKVTDRGGRINISNGLYHIDLLVANRTEANKFGRRRGKAVIGVTESSSGASSGSSNNSTANKAVELVKKQLGKKYVWGATGPSTFDCSGLMQWVYKQYRVNLPRTSSEQSRHGKTVSKSNLQPGDLLFFSTNGTGKVSHVGMYVGEGKMVHAANPQKGVRTDSINSSYYSKAFTNARRVV